MNAEINIGDFMFLITERLVLRPFRETDLDDLYAYASVDGVGQMAGWQPHKDRKETEKVLKGFIEGKRTFAVELGWKVVGSVEVKEYDEEACPEFSGRKCRELGFALAKDCWGKGIMPEACKEVIRWLFAEEKLDLLLCTRSADNRQSARVQEKLGFKAYRTTETGEVGILTREDWEENGRDWEDSVTISVPRERPMMTQKNDVVYAEYGETKLKLQMILPMVFGPVKGKHPCMIFVQGSGWAPQNVYSAIPELSAYAGRGYVVAVVEYRDFTRGVFPDPVVDARNAVRFLRKNAAEYGIDPEKIVLTGDSSGGHTAMYAGLFHDDDAETNLYPGVSGEVRGIVNFYGSTDFTFDNSNPVTSNHNLPDSPEGQIMGKQNLREHPELAEKLSVICQISEDTVIPPSLILHGTGDFVVSRYCSIRLYERLKACGKDTDIVLVRGAGHGGAEFYTDEVVNTVCGFMERVCS